MNDLRYIYDKKDGYKIVLPYDFSRLNTILIPLNYMKRNTKKLKA